MPTQYPVTVSLRDCNVSSYQLSIQLRKVTVLYSKPGIEFLHMANWQQSLRSVRLGKVRVSNWLATRLVSITLGS